MHKEIGIIGTSIWQQNLPLLECLTLDRENREERLHEIKHCLGVDELIYLSTCNRVEFLFAWEGDLNIEKIRNRLIDYFFKSGRQINFAPNDYYQFDGRGAVEHLFKVVSSLDSLVVGETQITGQFKEAHQDARALQLSGPTLDRLAREALKVARKVRSQTSVGVGAVSMASLAAAEVKEHLAKLDEPLIALIGAGEMTGKLANYINDQRLGRILFVNRTFEKAKALAAKHGGSAVGLNEFLADPTEIDAIVSATAASDPVFGDDFLSQLEAASKVVICVDLAIPRDFTPEFNSSSAIKLVDIPFLKAKNQKNLREKFREAGKANEIVNEAIHSYLCDQIEISIKPIFQSSYQESIELAERAFDDLFAKKLTSLDGDEREAVLRLVTKLIGHSAFQPARKISSHLVMAQHEANPSTDSQQLTTAESIS